MIFFKNFTIMLNQIAIAICGPHVKRKEPFHLLLPTTNFFINCKNHQGRGDAATKQSHAIYSIHPAVQ